MNGHIGLKLYCRLDSRKEECDMTRIEAECLIRFKDHTEVPPDEHYGILFKNGLVLCLCCKGYLEPGEYTIINKNSGFEHLDATLKEYI